jgi:hypothetical protein
LPLQLAAVNRAPELEASYYRAPIEDGMDRPLPQLHLRDRRESTIAALCEHFAADRLDITEFENRLDEAHRARTSAALDALLQDLPAPRSRMEPAAPDPGGELARRGRELGAAVRDSRTLIAFMSGVERRGHWTPARKNVVVAVMGGAELDFREVDMPPGETEVLLFCMMGGAEIIVPPDLAVESSGIAIMGGFEHGSGPKRPPADAPVLRLSGVCFMGGVEISVREPGETAADARARRKAERREQRQARRRETE